MTSKLFAAITVTTALIATSAVAQTGGRKLQTAMTGAAEVPGPGDTDGTGSAQITVNSGQNKVCYKLRVANIAAGTMAHIHEGAPTVAGPVKVTLGKPGANGMSSGCVTVPRALAMDIAKRPADYYVNIHNAEFPNGAVRGQLAK